MKKRFDIEDEARKKQGELALKGIVSKRYSRWVRHRDMAPVEYWFVEWVAERGK